MKITRQDLDRQNLALKESMIFTSIRRLRLHFRVANAIPIHFLCVAKIIYHSQPEFDCYFTFAFKLRKQKPSNMNIVIYMNGLQSEVFAKLILKII
jgi:hypothetical protein